MLTTIMQNTVGSAIYNFLIEAFHLKVHIQDEDYIYEHCNRDLF